MTAGIVRILNDVGEKYEPCATPIIYYLNCVNMLFNALLCLHCFASTCMLDIWHLIFDSWQLTVDVWRLTFDIWHVTFGIWQLIFDIRQLTLDIRLLTFYMLYVAFDIWHFTFTCYMCWHVLHLAFDMLDMFWHLIFGI